MLRLLSQPETSNERLVGRLPIVVPDVQAHAMTPYFQRDGITIYHGDALDVCRTLTDPINAVVTDPPYSSGTRREASKGLRKSMTREIDDSDWFISDCLTTNGFSWLMRQSAMEWKRLLVPGGHVLVFIDWRMLPPLSGAIESADLRHIGVLVWDKTYFGMGAYFRNQHELILHFTKGKSLPPQRRNQGNVLSVPPIRNGIHPTEKPVPLMADLLSVVSAPGALVLDPFMGSGATLQAAWELGRRAIGIETEERYCEMAAKRLAQMPLGLPA